MRQHHPTVSMWLHLLHFSHELSDTHPHDQPKRHPHPGHQSVDRGGRSRPGAAPYGPRCPGGCGLVTAGCIGPLRPLLPIVGVTGEPELVRAADRGRNHRTQDDLEPDASTDSTLLTPKAAAGRQLFPVVMIGMEIPLGVLAKGVGLMVVAEIAETGGHQSPGGRVRSGREPGEPVLALGSLIPDGGAPHLLNRGTGTRGHSQHQQQTYRNGFQAPTHQSRMDSSTSAPSTQSLMATASA